MSERKLHPAAKSAASLRGELWAEQVVRTLVARWPSWRRTPRALAVAARKVADLAGADAGAHGELASVCFEAGRRRFIELVEFLQRRRRNPPHPTPADDLPR
jgi:hypothetical protein